MPISIQNQQPTLELYEGGETVPVSAHYTLVDDTGKKHDYVIVKLKAGETFPAIPLEHLSYMLMAPCDTASGYDLAE